MTTSEILEQLQNKLSQIEKIIGSTHQAIIECLWSDVLQELVTYGNTTFPKNFRYRLVMEHE